MVRGEPGVVIAGMVLITIFLTLCLVHNPSIGMQEVVLGSHAGCGGGAEAADAGTGTAWTFHLFFRWYSGEYCAAEGEVWVGLVMPGEVVAAIIPADIKTVINTGDVENKVDRVFSAPGDPTHVAGAVVLVQAGHHAHGGQVQEQGGVLHGCAGSTAVQSNKLFFSLTLKIKFWFAKYLF